MSTDSSAAAKNGDPTVSRHVVTMGRHGAGIVDSMHRGACWSLGGEKEQRKAHGTL